jgi:3-oxoadipate enol-lactonase
LPDRVSLPIADAQAPPPLVLLHGIGTGPDAWQPQIDELAPTRQVLAPALEPSLARAVAQLDGLGLPRADICGLSFGSIVALRYALEHPERVSRLVLTAGFAWLPPVLRSIPYVTSALLAIIPRAPHELAAPMRECARFDVRAQAARLETPALVLCGARDRVNLRLSRTLAGLLPNARFETIPAAGHVASVDNPPAFNAALCAFLSEPVRVPA